MQQPREQEAPRRDPPSPAGGSTSNVKSRARTRASARSRFRGLTCANCRARKIRCEGSQPSCKTCEAYHDECRYDKAPPVSQVLALVARLQEAEQALSDLRAERASAGPANGISCRESGPQPQLRGPYTLSHSAASPAVDRPACEAPSAGTPNAIASCAVGHIYSPETSSFPHSRAFSSAPQALPPEPDVTGPSDVTVDEHGEICYYGPTSAVHDPPSADSPVSHSSTVGTRLWSKTDIRLALNAYEQECSTWEDFALGNASLETGIPRAVMTRLLHLHWTWIAPMFSWVYRPAFVRDMATGGRYYSEFLLIVMCAHAAKYQDGGFVDVLLARGRRLLGMAIQQPSSIPTIQALLQLSARDLAHGSMSQAWVYSGIAFRMAGDLGLQHSGVDVKGMSAVDLTVRRRLFWSCYFWDKATSLYAGRLPVMTEALPRDTLDLLDDNDQSETWSPYYGDSITLPGRQLNQYPTMRSHSVSCLVNSCKLSIIINDIILQLYDRRNRTLTEEAIGQINARLDAWRAQSPSYLKYDPDHLPAVCPPPHIVAQNLLYFTTIILANRPFWSMPAYYRVCISASTSIEKLIRLMESTFGLGHITYLIGYCIYTGASAILEDAKLAKGTANETLQTYLRALNAGMKKCPLLERSLNIIVKGLARSRASHVSPQAEDSRPVANVQPSSGAYNSYIPAFPYLGPDMSLGFDLDPGFGSHGSMAALDCFPEMQLSSGDLMYPNIM